MASRFLLGIDTGGTYTDAVLFSPEDGVKARAKALTTRHDLSEGIRGAVGNVLAETGTDPSAIRLASLSTTLATNALVEGQGGRVCLVMVGFGPEDLERDGLRQALGTDPVVFLPGGHNVHGHETILDTGPLADRLDGLADTVTAFAVAGYFYYYGHWYAALCIDLLPPEERPYFQDHLAHILLPLQEKDGSWWDYPLYDYHHTWGTAMAVSSLVHCLHD